MKNKSSLQKVSMSLILLFVSLNACKEAASKEPAVDAILKMENDKKSQFDALKNFAANYAAAWSGRDPAAVAAFFAPDGSLKVNENDPAVGREAINEVARGFMDAFPDMKVVMDSLMQQPDGLEFHWTLTGTYAGPEGAGNKVKISGFELWQLSPQGLIQTSLGQFDADVYNRQLQGE